MKIQVERDVLAEAVAWTARALPARPAVPVLAGIRLQAAADLTLSSFDYDVSAQARVPVEAEEEGEALVSGRLLAEPARPPGGDHHRCGARHADLWQCHLHPAHHADRGLSEPA